MAFASKSNTFVTSCCTKEKCGWERSAAIFRSAPVIKLSAHSTLCPSSSKRAQRWEPIKPAPPVTTIFKNRTSKHEEKFLSSIIPYKTRRFGSIMVTTQDCSATPPAEFDAYFFICYHKDE